MKGANFVCDRRQFANNNQVLMASAAPHPRVEEILLRLAADRLISSTLIEESRLCTTPNNKKRRLDHVPLLFI
jgi:hypothetical protein